MSEKSLPYYERNLDSYADHIICFVRQNREGHWRAVLDCGLTSDPADPDFASHGYGRSMEEAAKRCADVVRADALGIGKFAPHSVLVPGYELHFKLMRHWAKKERFEELGYDPNHMVKMALTATERDQWKMRSGSLIKQWDSTRIMEFEFQLLMAEGFHWIREKDADQDYVRESVLEGLRQVIRNDARVGAPTDETWDMVNARMDEMLADVGYSAAMSR